MGTSVNVQLNSNSDYVRSLENILQIMMYRATSVLHRFDWFFKLTPLYRKHQKCLKILHEYNTSLILSKRLELNSPLKIEDIEEEKIENGLGVKTDVSTNSDQKEFGIKKKTAFLDLLLSSTLDGKPLTDKDIREEVDTFMFAVNYIYYEIYIKIL